MKIIKIIVLISILSIHLVQAQSILKSPEEFLGYPLGEAFTYHHRIIDYFKYIAANSPKVELTKYGETYEKRPLVVALISNKENLDRIEEIRLNNLRRAGLVEGTKREDDIAIVWLSYNVHGNEAVSAEAAMSVLYNLAAGEIEAAKDWLKNTVVIIDPVLNPDGRERYVSWYMQNGNMLPNVNPDAIEHHEPWPGGRANHYLFDLNRDWAWQTQKESKSRMKMYNQWLPHIHADFHEQEIESPYYMAPAAEPFHAYVTDWQKEFQTSIGINTMNYFDDKGWLYFTRENFDLLYPSYGDTYPTFNGAIGMTFEQGGSGRAGLAVKTEEGDTLSLKERIEHHTTSSFSIVEITSKKAKEVIENYEAFYKIPFKEKLGKYSSYVFPLLNSKDKLLALRNFLEVHQIEYSEASKDRTVKGWSFEETKQVNLRINKGDLVINVKQPKGTLLQVLFEPETSLSDSLTYDITAWAIPYMMGLQAYATNEELPVKRYQDQAPLSLETNSAKPYAYLLEWQSIADVKFLSSLLKQGIKVRISEEAFEISNKRYKPGTIIITRNGNEKFEKEFDGLIGEAAQQWDRKVLAVNTGFVAEGKDFGSGSVKYLKEPKVAVLAGEGVSSLAFGEVWHFFEQQISYPLTIIGTEYAREIDWNNYDVLILPNGNYSGVLNHDMLSSLNGWIKRGGKLILMEDAIKAVHSTSGDFLSIKAKKDEVGALSIENNLLREYKNKERESIENITPGSIFRVSLDHSHPLAFGYEGDYFSLKRGNAAFNYLQHGWNVGTIRSTNDKVSGFVGDNLQGILKESLVFGVEEIGKGEIIYMVDNPLFRAFWENGKLLFSNAVFMVGQ